MNSAGVVVYVVENARRRAESGSHGGGEDEKMRRLDEAYGALMGDIDGIVGVDCEGTDSARFQHLRIKHGCQMVQVSSPRVVVVECITDKRGAGRGKGAGLSDPLRRILGDATIAKAFCDASGDVRGLRAEMDALDVLGEEYYGVNNVVDVQTLARERGHDVKKAGLAQVVTFAVGFDVKKLSIKKKGWWRLKNVEAMVREEGFLEYAAADAWGTWLSHEYLAGSSRGVKYEDKMGLLKGLKGSVSDSIPNLVDLVSSTEYQIS